ncbi:MAG TPA: BamA/TamA family outer membrane protein, partial [Vicinamibacterales bacterium]|nr:BamA/TamA family outer membrane protein [Vicinamibacterales bacterium]
YATGNLRRLTNDKFGDLQPSWSPDGRTIAFATERGETTDLDLLKFGQWQIALYDLATGGVTVIPAQDGLNINPQWAPDGKSIAFVSDRTGIANIFLYDFAAKEHYQLTNVIGSVNAITEYSPAITWARGADKLAFTYFENGDYTVWMTSNPRQLKGEPFRPRPAAVVAQRDSGAADGDDMRQRANDMLRAIETASRAADSTQGSATETASLYRSTTGIRPSADAPASSERTGAGAPISVAQLLDSANLALPDTTKFLEYDYKVGYQPEAIARPSIGYAQDNYGRGLYGGAGVILSDLLGNNRVILAGQVNGRLSEAYFLGGYTNLANRIQYSLGVSQTPIFLPVAALETPFGDGSARAIQEFEISRYILREAFAVAMRPSNRFTRAEFGVAGVNVARSTAFLSRQVDYLLGFATDFQVDSVRNYRGLNYIAPYVAWVSDNTLFGYTGPIAGRRYRLQFQPVMGGLNWIDYSIDYRRYVPILFNFLTVAWRAQASLSVGNDEADFLKYIGRADFVRGYDRQSYGSQVCGGLFGNSSAACSATELLGSRFALANVELRFPLVRRFDLGVIPISLPPVDGLVFYDMGLAWTGGQDVSFSRPDNYDEDLHRYPLRSYGLGIRLNLFGLALVRWDYAIPLDRPNRRGYWIWTLGPSF